YAALLLMLGLTIFVEVLAERLGRGGTDADFALFAALVEDNQVSSVHLVERQVTQLTQPDTRIEKHQQERIVAEAEGCVEIAGIENWRKVVRLEGRDKEVRQLGPRDPACEVDSEQVFADAPGEEGAHRPHIAVNRLRRQGSVRRCLLWMNLVRRQLLEMHDERTEVHRRDVF